MLQIVCKNKVVGTRCAGQPLNKAEIQDKIWQLNARDPYNGLKYCELESPAKYRPLSGDRRANT